MRRTRFSFLFQALSFGTLFGALFFLSPRAASADSFNWQNVNGSNWNSTVKSQFGGTCWDFGSVATFEAKYMLSRNDPSFVPDMSEQQLCWETNPDLGGTGGGGGTAAMAYLASHGVVSELECPVETNSAYWDSPGPGDPWPLASGWQNRCWISTANTTPFVTSTTAGIKAALKVARSAHDRYLGVQRLVQFGRRPGSQLPWASDRRRSRRVDRRLPRRCEGSYGWILDHQK